MISNVFRQRGHDRHRKSLMLRWMQVNALSALQRCV
jgi:hypothetical protein